MKSKGVECIWPYLRLCRFQNELFWLGMGCLLRWRGGVIPSRWRSRRSIDPGNWGQGRKEILAQLQNLILFWRLDFNRERQYKILMTMFTLKMKRCTVGFGMGESTVSNSCFLHSLWLHTIFAIRTWRFNWVWSCSLNTTWFCNKRWFRCFCKS